MPAPCKYLWKVAWEEWATTALDKRLAEGWEPFGATHQYVWLRKRTLVAQ